MMRRQIPGRDGAAAAPPASRLSENQRLALCIGGLLLIRLALYGWLAGGLPALPTALCHWDCDWYQGVAIDGYATHPKTTPDATFGQATWAFFPVYPALVAGATRAFGVPTLTAAIAVANAALCIFAFIGAKYLDLVSQAGGVQKLGGPALLVFLFAFPYSFFFSLPYSESVYAALAMAAFWCLARRRVLGASAVAALLSATRVTGVLLTPAIALPYGLAVWRALRRGERAAAAAAFAAALLPVALAPLGLFLFMLYLYVHTGDGLAFLHIQRAWNRVGGNPVMALWQGVTQFDLFSFAPRVEESGTLNALSALAGLLLSAWLLIRRRYAESWFLALSIVIPASHGLDSLARYTLAQPLFMVFLFDAVRAAGSRLLFWGVVALSVTLQLFLVRLWMHGYAFLH